jgi:hypothetical protein
MTRFKTIVTAVTAVAAFSVVVAPVASATRGLPPVEPLQITTIAPADGTKARPNDGRFRVSAEAIRANNAQLCEDLWTSFETSVQEAVKYDRAGNTKARNEQLDQATDAKNDAKKQGCSWA